MSAPALREKLRAALERRAPLRQRQDTTAFRAFNGRGDGVEDLTVDWFDGVAVLSLYRPFEAREEQRLAQDVEGVLGARAVYLKRRPREARVVANVARQEVAPPAPLAGKEVESLQVLENGRAFVIRPGQGLSVGLYLDMRDTRAWLAGRLRGKSVLNTFAYTCAFGVYALTAGAARALNLDLSRRVLDWGEENLRRNGLEPLRRDHLAGDTFDWLRRFGKKGEAFDAVVLDPPSFSTSRHGRFSAARDYSRLVEAAAKVVSPGGLLVACCNLEELVPSRFEAQVAEGLRSAGIRGRLVQRLGPSPVDFPEAPGEKAALKVRVYEVG